MSDTDVDGGVERKTTDADLLAAVESAIEAGDTRINGLPSYRDISEHCAISDRTVSTHIPRLVDEGRVKTHQPLGPNGARVATVEVIDDE